MKQLFSGRGRGSRRGWTLGLITGGVILAASFGLTLWVDASRADRQRQELEWESFREALGKKIGRARTLVDRAAAFEPAEALRQARSGRRNGFTYRFLDHLDAAMPVGAGPGAPEDDAPARVFTWATLGDETRPSIELAPGQRVRFSVSLPDEPLELMLGAGVEEAAPDGRLELLIAFGGREATIASISPSEDGKWTQTRVALPHWATDEGTVEFRFDGEGEAPLVLSEPVIFGQPEQRLNVVLILEDTLRSDHLSGYGYHRRTSPAKDAFFAGGVVFEHPFSHAPTTFVSCPSIMTSLYPSATGVFRHGDRIPEKALTLAEILRAQGYATASVIQNPYAGAMTGLHRGFERVRKAMQNERRPTSEEVYASAGIERLDDFSGRNFFLYLHTFDPHHPYTPDDVFMHAGAEFADNPGEQGDDPLTLAGGPDAYEQGSFEGDRFQYGGEIRANDFYFQQFVEALEERDLLDETLIIFLSDHGEYFGERDRRVHSSPGYVQVLHVPLMMRHPALLPAGMRIEQPVQLVDVVPTVLELLDIPREPFLLSGDSLMPLIHGEADATGYWADRVLLSEEDHRTGASFVRGPWHVISSRAFMRNYDKFETYRGPRLWWKRWKLSGQQIRIFNYRQDRQERNSLEALTRNAAFREEFLAMRKTLLDEYAGVNALLQGEELKELEVEPEVIEQLKDLGYL